jgi:hypothetical protein
MAILLVGRDINGYPTWAYDLTTNNYNINLTANNEETIEVPPNMTKALIRYQDGTTVWVATGSTPITLPTSSFEMTTGQLKPDLINVQSGMTLRFVTEDTQAIVGISFYEK